jgi:hypothetical protein
MRPNDRREPPPLASRYRRTGVADARRRLRRALDRWQTAALARSPVHYERDDMRGIYGWRRALLDAAATTLVTVWGARAVATAVLLGPLTAGPRAVVAANLLVSVVVLAASAALAAYRSDRPPLRDRLGRE